MKTFIVTNWSRIGLLGVALMATAATGCQTTVGGQTLPSGYYLRDDVQFFPAGPEFILSKQVQALEDYQQQRAASEEGFEDELP